MEDAIGWHDGGRWDCVMLEFEGVGDALGPGVGCNDFDASVTVERRCYVPPVDGMLPPRFASARLDVEQHFGARWRHWCSIERV